MDAELARATYDTVAGAYAQMFFDELERKPFDRELLDEFAIQCGSDGTVLDIGCGPGHVARYLHDSGLSAQGLDISPEMVALARRLNPGMEFAVGDMRRLEVPDGHLRGLTAFYSLIHIPREGVPEVLREFQRVVAPGGRLLVTVHGGHGVVRRDEFLGQQVPFEATLFRIGEIAALVEEAGFWVDAARQRPPYAFEHQTPRIYVGAHVAV